MSIRSFWLIVLLSSSITLLLLCCSINYSRELFHYPITFVDLSVSPFSSTSFSFIYFLYLCCLVNAHLVLLKFFEILYYFITFLIVFGNFVCCEEYFV